MSTRRAFLVTTGLLVSGIATARAQDSCTVFNTKLQSAISPDEALQRLKDGNARFVSGLSVQCDLLSQVKKTAGGQAPFAAILSCMDSRVPPELVFDQRIGDIFSVRIAGNFASIDILGSLEYATKVAGSKLIVVLGHSDCGAIKGAIDGVKLGNLTHTLANIRSAVVEASDAGGGDRSSKNKLFVQRVADQNVKDAAAALIYGSAVIASLVSEHKLKIAPAMYQLSTGMVDWLA